MQARIALILLTLMLPNAPIARADTHLQASKDSHSFANPDNVRVKHVDLDLDVRFERKALEGTATLTVERPNGGDIPLVLDTRALKINAVEASTDGATYSRVEFALGAADSILGSPLTIRLPAAATKVRIAYASVPEASGLQWLEPAQTAGKKRPFLFTQSQAIHARSWIPLQDTPAVRITYSARIRTPKDLVAVMSAANDPAAARDGDYSFKMDQPIPAYLMALAVGDIAFEATGPRTGVYAEPSVVKAAAREFSDTEKMVQAAEKLYGPYRWDRYDLLVLPPSFPIGGMENPRLTFATPTVIAGDKSLVSLVAHELAHSWSGNLVTNATWSDLWLNEGFTVYVERRIVEEIYGRPREEMEAVLGRQTLEEELAKLEPRDQELHINLDGRDPDDVFSNVPYEKGHLFLRQLEETFGRERFDKFLRGYFDHFAFRSITTEDFLAYLKANLLDADPVATAKVPIEEWIYKPGLPASSPRPSSDAFAKVEAQAKRWIDGAAPAKSLDTSKWSTQEWLHFLKFLPAQLDAKRMADLDKAFKLTQSGNAEIAHVWLLMSIRNRYAPADARLEQYLTSIGRRKLIRPLYEELVKTPEGKQRAMAIYRKARPGYHPIAAGTLDPIVGWKG
jgi:leukotriene-A4 hydrolase